MMIGVIMGKILVIAEKPSVARDYARVLKCTTKRDGYLEGEGYVVSWALGHLISLAEPQAYDPKYKKWQINDLPIIPDEMALSVVKKVSKQFSVLKRLMNDKNTDHIICGTDSGREGELIFRYIYHHANCKKSFSRLWISSMTDIAIKEGFEALKPGEDYDNLYFSAKSRSEADWLVGINSSRAFSIKYNALLSIGRVQTPTLSIIVSRQQEIENFVPKTYYELIAECDTFKGTWFKLDEGKKDTKIFDETKAYELREKVSKHTKGTVKTVKKQKKKIQPPLLYDLTELQRDGNKKFGYSAQEVLSIAQSLYETKKVITYPRTDSRYLTDDMKDTVRQTMKKVYIEPFKEAISQLTELKFTKRIINASKVTDHNAIIPTNTRPNLNLLTKEELNIYKLIVYRFIEVFFKEHTYETTEIVFLVDGESFVAKGKVILDLGWMKVQKANNKKEEILPKVKKGETIPIQGYDLLQKKTTPPKPYTEATLLTAMEHAGKFIEDEALKETLKSLALGTPATRAGIIERLIQVGYLKRKGKTLVATEKGIKLIEVVPDELKSPETTGKWERGLARISEGDMDPGRFMNSIRRYVYYITDYVNKNKKQIIFPQEVKKGKHANKKPKNALGKCPLCQEGDVIKNSKAYFCTNWRGGCKFTIWFNELSNYGIELKDPMIKKLLKEQKIDKVKMYLPQTKERCEATLTLEKTGKLELKNVIRVKSKGGEDNKG
jgi:DNA topoisomerase-3